MELSYRMLHCARLYDKRAWFRCWVLPLGIKGALNQKCLSVQAWFPFIEGAAKALRCHLPHSRSLGSHKPRSPVFWLPVLSSSGRSGNTQNKPVPVCPLPTSWLLLFQAPQARQRGTDRRIQSLLLLEKGPESAHRTQPQGSQGEKERREENAGSPGNPRSLSS